MEFQKIRYEDGQKKEKLMSFEQKEIIEGILCLINKNQIVKKSFMQEYLPLNKKNILKIKSSSYKKNFLNIQLSKTLVQELIMIEKDLKPFWNKYSIKMSKKLWLPQKIDLSDSGSNYLNSFLINSVPESKLLIPKNVKQVNKNWQKICYPLLQFSPPDIMEKENIQQITRKIRIYPNKKQKTFFNKCFGVTRFIYNKTVDFIVKKYKEKINKIKIDSINGCVAIKNNKQCCKKITDNFLCEKHTKYRHKNNIQLTLPFLRKNVLVNDKELDNSNIWQKKVPYDTRQLAIKDFISAYKAANTNYKKGNTNGFTMGFKSKRNKTQIFHIDKNALKDKLNLFKKRKIGKLRTRNKMTKWVKTNIKQIEHDCKIMRNGANQYFLLLTIDSNCTNSPTIFNMVSLDPGVRTFQTFYSNNGISGKFGHNFTKNRLLNRAKLIDKLTSILTKLKQKRTINNIKHRISLLRTKIKNCVNDLHWKTINFLTKNFNIIILPKFQVKNMTKLTSNCRKITSKTTRHMLLLSHYSFQQKLKYKCINRKRKLLLVDESYTSQTCGNCGNRKKNLGGIKTYNCEKCKISIDRDINGARNIMLKTLAVLQLMFIQGHDTGSLNLINFNKCNTRAITNKENNLKY